MDIENTGTVFVSETVSIMNIIAISQGFFLGIVLLVKKNNNLSNRILALLFLAISVSMIMNYFHMTQKWSAFYCMIYVNLSFYLLYGPLMYLYTLSITGSIKKPLTRYLRHFLPFAVFLSYMVVRHRIIEWTGAMDFKPFYENTSLFSYPNLVILFLFVNLGYICRSLHVVREYKKSLEEYFSDVQRISLIWLSLLLSGAMIFIILIIAFLLLFRDLTVNYFKTELVMIIYITYLATIYMATFFTIRYPQLFNEKMRSEKIHEDEEKNGTRAPKYEKLKLDDSLKAQYTDELLHYMKLSKPYLNDSLTLRDLAGMINIPYHHLSLIINTDLKQNFYQFINTYRVEEAKTMLTLEEYKDFTILTIAFNSGFNSKTTFNTIFKQITGHTPSEYRKLHASAVL
ncbi:MAG TPA: helix-turn-helix domain-containing protein [Spirochaetota bacterium]|nr:helix-turn-helix domain-containing protein [Spirochaetota bacterium]